MSPSHTTKTAYGIDLSGDRLVVARCTRRRKTETQDILYSGSADGNVQAVSSAVGDAGGAIVAAAAMPSHISFARWLSSPLTSEAKARKVLPSLLDIQLPFPLERCVYDFIVTRKDSAGGIDALAAAARTDDVEAYLREMQSRGVDPEILDHSGLALWEQSVREAPLERNAVRVVCCLTDSFVTLVIGRGSATQKPGDLARAFVSSHGIRLGVRNFNASDAEQARKKAQQFVSRVQQILRAEAPETGNGSPLQWFWTGNGAENSASTSGLETFLALPEARFMTHREPGSFLARAVAVRALGTDFPCNLRTGSLAHPLTAARRKQDRNAAANLCLVAGLALILLYGAWQGALAQERQALGARLEAAASEITGMPKVPRGQEVLLSRRAMEEQNPGLALFLQSFEPPVTATIGDLLATAKEHGILLESLTVRRDAVSLRGAAADWDSCEVLAEHLRENGFLPEMERNDAGADEQVHFALSATCIESSEGTTP